MLRTIASAGLTAILTVAAMTACSGKPAATPPSGGATTSASSASPTKITAFAVSNENLNVDKVGLRDGLFTPDGNRDLVFTATIDGPFDAIFVVSTNAKGEPSYGLRADTQSTTEPIPEALGGIIDTGKMTIPIGVVEGKKFINGESGSVHAGPGVHNLTLYMANTATLNPGSFVRAYVKVPGGALVPGPIAPY